MGKNRVRCRRVAVERQPPSSSILHQVCLVNVRKLLGEYIEHRSPDPAALGERCEGVPVGRHVPAAGLNGVPRRAIGRGVHVFEGHVAPCMFNAWRVCSEQDNGQSFSQLPRTHNYSTSTRAFTGVWRDAVH